MTKKLWFIIVNCTGVSSIIFAADIESFSLEYWIFLIGGNVIGQVIYRLCKD